MLISLTGVLCLFFIFSPPKLGVVEHTLTPALRKLSQKDRKSRPAWTVEQDPVSDNNEVSLLSLAGLGLAGLFL